MIKRSAKDGRASSRIPKSSETASRDWIVTTDELADLLGYAPGRLTQLADEGILEKTGLGKWNLPDCTKRIVKWLRSRTTVTDLKAEKLRMENELLQISLQKARSEVRPIAEVERAWSDICLTVRQRILRIPNKVAPRLLFCKSEAEMEREIQSEVEEALLELSRGPDGS